MTPLGVLSLPSSMSVFVVFLAPFAWSAASDHSEYAVFMEKPYIYLDRCYGMIEFDKRLSQTRSFLKSMGKPAAHSVGYTNIDFGLASPIYLLPNSA